LGPADELFFNLFKSVCRVPALPCLNGLSALQTSDATVIERNCGRRNGYGHWVRLPPDELLGVAKLLTVFPQLYNQTTVQ
jgi:hypothetical protein